MQEEAKISTVQTPKPKETNQINTEILEEEKITFDYLLKKVVENVEK